MLLLVGRRLYSPLRQRPVRLLDGILDCGVLTGGLLIFARLLPPPLVKLFACFGEILVKARSDLASQLVDGLHTALDVPDAEVLVEVRGEPDLDTYKAVRILDATRKDSWNVRVVDLPVETDEANRSEIVRYAESFRELVAA